MTGWDKVLAELESKRGFSREGGGDERIARQHAAGRLTARERADALFDHGQWVEIGALAANRTQGEDRPAPADGLIAGFGEVAGRRCLTMIEDFTVLGGSIGDAGAAKRERVTRMALEQRVPLVIMLEGAGHRLTNSHATPAPNDLQVLADCKGVIPLVTLVTGPSAGHGALAAPMADFVVMTQQSALFVAGPPVVKGALGQVVTKEELGGPEVHLTQSGVAHNRAADDGEAIALAKQYLGFLNRGGDDSREDLATIAQEQPIAAILDIVDPDPMRPYAMRRLVEAIADADSALVLQPEWGASILVALARLGGQATMILANDPSVRAGAIDADAAQKAAHFLEVADAHGWPVVFLADNPGVMPGAASERGGMLRHAAAMFAAQRRLRVPKIHVTIRKAFGFGSSVMAMNPHDRQTVALAFPAIALGAMPAASGAQAAKLDDRARADALRAQSGAAWDLAGKLAYDDVIDPRDLRKAIRRALLLARDRPR